MNDLHLPPIKMKTREELQRLKAQEDTKRLITRAMGRGPEPLDRNVKAWLKPPENEKSVYLDYQRLIETQNEKSEKNKDIIKDILNQAKTSVETGKISFGKKIMLQLAPKPTSQQTISNQEYIKIKHLLDVRLVDFKFSSGKEYLDGIRDDCKAALKAKFLFERETRITKEVIENPKTTRKER